MLGTDPGVRPNRLTQRYSQIQPSFYIKSNNINQKRPKVDPYLLKSSTFKPAKPTVSDTILNRIVAQAVRSALQVNGRVQQPVKPCRESLPVISAQPTATSTPATTIPTDTFESEYVLVQNPLK